MNDRNGKETKKKDTSWKDSTGSSKTVSTIRLVLNWKTGIKKTEIYGREILLGRHWRKLSREKYVKQGQLEKRNTFDKRARKLEPGPKPAAARKLALKKSSPKAFLVRKSQSWHVHMQAGIIRSSRRGILRTRTQKVLPSTGGGASMFGVRGLRRKRIEASTPGMQTDLTMSSRWRARKDWRST